MLDVSPVLAGTAYAANAAPVGVNFTTTGGAAASTDVDDAHPVDPRRYSKFDRTASQVGTASLSFGDVLDMVNPLQHIPVVSSVYRAITGDTINPVSRVVGDIMYGGAAGVVTGMATALASGAGAVADSVMEAKTGKDVKGTMLAELFGGDTTGDGDGTAQVAVASGPALANSSNAPPQAASAAPSPTLPAQAMASTVAAAYGNPATQAAQNPAAAANKLPFGGVMAPVKSLQQQNMAMALASATSGNGIRLGGSIYNNRFMNGPHPAPAVVASTAPLPAKPAPATPPAASPAVTNTPASTPVPAATAANTNAAALPSSPVPGDGAIPSSLSDDALILRALGLYQNVATGAGARSGNASQSSTTLN